MIDPEFMPSVPEPTREERAYALTALNNAYKESLAPDVYSRLPEDVVSILGRDAITSAERAVYQRDDTALIPERMLVPGKPLEFNDILGMLHVYFWWNSNYERPAEYLQDLLKDLSDKRFKEATRALHANFIANCAVADEGTGCKRLDGYKCFKAWLKIERDQAILQSKDDRAEEVTVWLEGILDDDEDEDTPEELKLGHYLAQYAVERLLDAGVDLVEANYARNVLHREEERRYDEPVESVLEQYAEYRSRHSYAQALTDFWVKQLTSPLGFANLLKEYVDIPTGAVNWDQSLKRALARRYIVENPEFLESVEDTYLFEIGRTAPFFIRRFAEGTFPPDQRI